MSLSRGALCSCSGKRASTCWRVWRRALESTNALRGSRTWLRQIYSFCIKPLDQLFNHLSMKSSACRSWKRWPSDVRLSQVIFRPYGKSWAQQRYSCHQMISPALDVRSPPWPDHRISAATSLPPELIERRYSPGIVARGKPSMCFAMPLRSARRFVGFHGDPADYVRLARQSSGPRRPHGARQMVLYDHMWLNGS